MSRPAATTYAPSISSRRSRARVQIQMTPPALDTVLLTGRCDGGGENPIWFAAAALSVRR